MTSYFDNFKWIISNKEEHKANLKSPDKFEIVENHKSNEIESNCDFGSEYNNNHTYQKNIHDVIYQYNTIHLEMIEKEQLVRDRLSIDTIDKIKTNYYDYINDDIKIIKDFAMIMETFSHIQKKLNDFESGIRVFELDVRNKTLNQDTNNQEFENKIQQIDVKLDNTIKFMEEIKLNNDLVMKKIIKLENTINDNDIKGNELLARLEKINITNNDDKKENNIIIQHEQYKYPYIPMCNDFNGILIYVITGSCIVGTYFGIKYLLRKY